MAERVLITGGAGFIGRYVARALVARGHEVRVLDSMIEQVHQGRRRPDGLPKGVEFIAGDVRDETAVLKALKGVDAVVHLAAEVGVGQSMYAVDRYVSVNDYGTAILFQQLIDNPVRRVVVASSMSIYGEGLYRTADGDLVEDAVRAPRADPADPWDPVDAQGRPLVPVPTPEWKRPALASVYALGKYVQERLTLTLSPAYGMEGVALRLWNVYGPGQALSNPYTGVLAIFASRLLNDRPPLVYEDGGQRRDFVNVADVARACRLALERDGADGRALNIGSGESVTVTEIGQKLASVLDVAIEPEVTGKFRAGDIRHCFADVSLAREALGFEADVALEDGMAELAAWLEGQVATDRFDEAAAELTERGLTT
ncbi:MAG: NAD-dependent epimerase/dehydratase family protein [Microvirga sp.]